MFTGIIEETGRLSRVSREGGGWCIGVAHDPWESPMVPGESVSVQGVCLTVTTHDEGAFACDVLDETMSRSSLGARGEGAWVNLERAMRAGDRFGGHIVSGHVDGTGTVSQIRAAGRDKVVAITCDASLSKDIVLKGSVACDGISLTVSAVSDEGFEVNVVPFTMEQTTLGEARVGDKVNIETDMLAKYVRAHLEREGKEPSGLTWEKLADAGYR